METSFNKNNNLIPFSHSLSHSQPAIQRGSGNVVNTLVRCSSPKARALLPVMLARKLAALPLHLEDSQSGDEGTLTVALAEPLSIDIIKELEFVTGRRVRGEVFPYATIIEAIPVAYGGDADFLRDSIEGIDTPNSAVEQDIRRPLILLNRESESGIPELLDAVLLRGRLRGATDIHLEFKEKFRLLFRCDGSLREEQLPHPVSRSSYLALLRRIKILAGLDTSGFGRPQEGVFARSIDGQSHLEFRVSILPQANTERVALRFHGGSSIFAHSPTVDEVFADLGFAPQQETVIRAVLGGSSGLVLLVGPTGCGKTTLLYSFAYLLGRAGRMVFSLEDPIESELPFVSQIPLNRTAELSLTTATRALLRHDPEVLVFGEVRDEESAKLATEAALTGHLVLATVHAGSTIEGVVRFADLGVPIDRSLQVLRLLIGPRLIPKICANCKELLKEPGDLLLELFQLPKATQLWRGRGCQECSYGGTAGRLRIAEVCPITDRIRLHGNINLLLNRRASRLEMFQVLKRVALAQGVQPMVYQLRQQLVQGVIDPIVALRGMGIDSNLSTEFSELHRSQ